MWPRNTVRYIQICTAFKNAHVHVFMTKIHTHMHCLWAMHMCMYLHVCRHVCVRHTCTYALDTAPMSQDTCRYSQIHTDTGMCISNVQCAYQICIELYPVHMSVHMCAVCDSHTCTYINPYLCYMCFTYMHICTGRITDDQCWYPFKGILYIHNTYHVTYSY